MRSEYALILVVILVVPLAASFDRHLALYRHWRELVKAVTAVAVPFWVWDIAATLRGHWWFNPSCVLGVTFLGLPVEEWCFFLVVPFVSIVTWESTKFMLGRKQ